MATATTSASSLGVIKASSPLDVWHLCLLPTSTPRTTSSSPRRPPTSEGDTSIFGSPSRTMAEHEKLPSVMETSYEVPHHMDLQHQDGDKMVEQGPSPSTTATSANLFNNMKMVPILDSSFESSYSTAHGDICTNISPTPTYIDMSHLSCEETTTP